MAELSKEASKMLNRTFELKHKNHWVADVIMLNLALLCFVQSEGHSQGSAHCLTFCNPLWGHSLWGCWVSSNLEHVCGVAGIHQQHKGRNLRGTKREFSFSSTAVQSPKVFWFLWWLPPGLKFVKNFIPLDFWANNFYTRKTRKLRLFVLMIKQHKL